ncbi:complexed with cef1p [Emydomyces testavorans]|uniref:Complexed with cef1p n=1 Tax=Emydomyces testavorans TaxID=2070801 RepID=A0AAF0DFS0_9EURO|nr:complexed with cef1p [Emydomyces testavorans]
MTTAHRPTFDPGKRSVTRTCLSSTTSPSAYSSKSSVRDLEHGLGSVPANADYRKPGQGGDADTEVRDLRAELLKAEAAHFAKKAGIADNKAPTTPIEAPAPKRQLEDSSDGGSVMEIEDLETKRRRILEETRDIDADSIEDESDSSEEESDDEEDETAELMRELEKIKRERAEQKEKEEQERDAKEQEQREYDIARGNPLLNPQDFSVKRRWDDDVVFKNQARGTENKGRKEFVNDLLRSDFHKRFMGQSTGGYGGDDNTYNSSRRDDGNFGSSRGDTYGSSKKHDNDSSYGTSGRSGMSGSYESGNKRGDDSYGSSRRDDHDTYGSSGRTGGSNTYGSGNDNTYGSSGRTGGTGSYGSSQRHNDDSYQSGRRDDNASYGSSRGTGGNDSYSSSRRDNTDSYGSTKRDNDTYGSSGYSGSTEYGSSKKGDTYGSSGAGGDSYGSNKRDNDTYGSSGYSGSTGYGSSKKDDTYGSSGRAGGDSYGSSKRDHDTYGSSGYSGSTGYKKDDNDTYGSSGVSGSTTYGSSKRDDTYGSSGRTGGDSYGSSGHGSGRHDDHRNESAASKIIHKVGDTITDKISDKFQGRRE